MKDGYKNTCTKGDRKFAIDPLKLNVVEMIVVGGYPKILVPFRYDPYMSQDTVS